MNVVTPLKLALKKNTGTKVGVLHPHRFQELSDWSLSQYVLAFVTQLGWLTITITVGELKRGHTKECSPEATSGVKKRRRSSIHILQNIYMLHHCDTYIQLVNTCIYNFIESVIFTNLQTHIYNYKAVVP